MSPLVSRVLFVDDSTHLLSAVRRTLRGRADLLVADNAAAALDLLQKDSRITVVVSDQNMPGMKGIEFLALVAKRWPLVTRVMQTGNNDQDTAISAIHDGRVFRFLRKPYEPSSLLAIIHEAQAEHEIRKAEHVLLETTLASSVKLLTEMLSLMRPDLFAQSTRVNELVRALAPGLKISQPWEIGLAALLYPLGLATLPEQLLERKRAGKRLSDAESFALAQSGVVAGQLVAKIPKLERVATYLRYCRKGYDGSGLPLDEEDLETPPGAIYLLPMLIDIVELAEVRSMSLGDAAQALHANGGKYHPHMLATTIDYLCSSGEFGQSKDRTVREVMAGEMRPGDVLISDLRDENGSLLLASDTPLTDIIIKRLQMLAESHSIPRLIAVTRAA